jgi:hypothetical protein
MHERNNHDAIPRFVPPINDAIRKSMQSITPICSIHSLPRAGIVENARYSNSEFIKKLMTQPVALGLVIIKYRFKLFLRSGKNHCGHRRPFLASRLIT